MMYRDNIFDQKLDTTEIYSDIGQNKFLIIRINDIWAKHKLSIKLSYYLNISTMDLMIVT